MKAIALAILIMISFLTPAQETTIWRGHTADGIYHETGLLKEWPESGPQMLWHYNGIGKGFSSPVFANGKIYISGMSDTIGHVFLFALDGELLNKFTYGPEHFISYPGARSSPTIAGELLYIMSGLGVVYCLDAGTGKVKWTKDLMKDFNGRNLRWGVTETIVLDGNRVYCTPGGTQYNMVALDRFTGDLVWESKGDGHTSAYCTPLLVEFPEGKILYNIMAGSVMAVRAKSGEKLWSHPFMNKRGIHPNTPIYKEGGLYCFSGYGYGGLQIFSWAY